MIFLAMVSALILFLSTPPRALVTATIQVDNSNTNINYYRSIDLINKEKYYDKQYEKAKITFIQPKYYENLDDLLNNIPQEYKVNYVVCLCIKMVKQFLSR